MALVQKFKNVVIATFHDNGSIKECIPLVLCSNATLVFQHRVQRVLHYGNNVKHTRIQHQSQLTKFDISCIRGFHDNMLFDIATLILYKKILARRCNLACLALSFFQIFVTSKSMNWSLGRRSCASLVGNDRRRAKDTSTGHIWTTTLFPTIKTLMKISYPWCVSLLKVHKPKWHCWRRGKTKWRFLRLQLFLTFGMFIACTCMAKKACLLHVIIFSNKLLLSIVSTLFNSCTNWKHGISWTNYTLSLHPTGSTC